MATASACECDSELHRPPRPFFQAVTQLSLPAEFLPEFLSPFSSQGGDDA